MFNPLFNSMLTPIFPNAFMNIPFFLQVQYALSPCEIIVLWGILWETLIYPSLTNNYPSLTNNYNDIPIIDKDEAGYLINYFITQDAVAHLIDDNFISTFCIGPVLLSVMWAAFCIGDPRETD